MGDAPSAFVGIAPGLVKGVADGDEDSRGFWMHAADSGQMTRTNTRRGKLVRASTFGEQRRGRWRAVGPDRRRQRTIPVDSAKV